MIDHFYLCALTTIEPKRSLYVYFFRWLEIKVLCAWYL